MLEIFKRILRDFFKEMSIFKTILVFFISFLVAILTILEPFFIKAVIESIEEFYKVWKYDFTSLIIIFVYWIIFIFVTIFTRSMYIYFLITKSNLNNYYNNFKSRAHLGLHMKYDTYLKKKFGTLFKIFDRWIENIFLLVEFIFHDLLINFYSITIIFWILFYIDRRMSIAIFAMVPFMVIIWVFFKNKTILEQEKVNNIYNKSIGYFWDSINNMWLLKILWLEKKMMSLIDDNLKEAYTKQLSVSKRWVVADVYINLWVMMSRFLVIFVGIYLITKWEISLATFILFYTYVGYIYFPLNYIFYKFAVFQKSEVVIKDFYNEFDWLDQDIDDWNTEELKNVKWKIEYKWVNFSYNKDKTIFKNLNFTLKPSEKIALVGHTGAWKSTIVNLLFRFFDLNSWEILIDNKNIKKLSIKSLRNHIWLVMQDSTLFNDTIKTNLLFAKEDATDKEIKEALIKASALFVLDLKEGINTIIWERWLKLSWGEKQRLNIARIILKNPEILVLDEATSALDNKTEIEIQKSLENLMHWKTTIIIAHRLSTIKKVDRIFFLENGEIKEEWNYNDLMKKKGKFYKLAEGL